MKGNCRMEEETPALVVNPFETTHRNKTSMISRKDSVI